ncbi:MAG TPA: putative maltokinase, partial [Casimicrobiaceae bacterium]|nr:putative maltokinase [Casimicrobiaceae bacterium]
NPQVLKAVFRVMRMWLDMGVDGFRLDAIPYLVEREGTNNENLPETHAVLKQLRAAVDANYPNVLLLAEANQWPEDVREYFGNGDECHMAYHFPLMPRMYMAIAQEDRHPITEIMAQTPDIPDSCQWAIFLRNHDELTLEMVTNRERDYMYQMYAADKRARINLGIRRRLAPLLENDVGRIKLMKSLLLSMPGSPILYYGDEIGMGDNIYLGDRDGVRTPMQWGPDRNAGFSRADPQRLYLQPIMDPIYGYQAVNVEAQLREPASLLHWTRRMLAVRKAFGAFGRGTLTFLRPGNRKVLAYLRIHADEILLCVANLSRSAQPVELDLSRFKGRVPIELLGRTPFPPIGDLPYLLTLAGHGFYWFRLAQDRDVPAWHEERLARDDLPVLVLFDGWSTLFRDRVVPWRIGLADKTREALEREALPRFVADRRWYASKGVAIRRVALADHALWTVKDRTWLLAIVHVETDDAATHPYFVPLTLAFEDRDDATIHALGALTIAKVRQQAAVGVLGDAFADESFSRALVAAMGRGENVTTARGTIRFERTSAFAELAGPDVTTLAVSLPGAQSSNTIVSLGDRLFVKAFRRLHAGENPEVEVGRFLTAAGFPSAVPFAGGVVYTGDDGKTATLAIAQGYVSNQGDAWRFTLDYLDRHFDALPAEDADDPGDLHGAYIAVAHAMGARTAELHATLAHATSDPAFTPEPMTAADITAMARRVSDEAEAVVTQLATRLDSLPPAIRTQAEALLLRREDLGRRIRAHGTDTTHGSKIRVHGDYHLGQLLIARNDVVITDFEGEPARPLEARRAKQSALKDVAGMLRSFDYAMQSAIAAASSEAPDGQTQIVAAAQRWREAARDGFIAGYDSVAAQAGLASPRAERNGLLELLVLEKAVYELRYELDNRPDWTGIPLAGLIEVLDTDTTEMLR